MKAYAGRRRIDLLWAPVAAALSGGLPGPKDADVSRSMVGTSIAELIFYLKAQAH